MNEKIILLTNPSTKKLLETTRIFVVVLGLTKSIPMEVIKVVTRKIKLPTVKMILFSSV